MKIVVIFIDKVSSLYIQQMLKDYENRLRHYCSLELLTISVPKTVRYKSTEEQKHEEAKLILKNIKEGDCVILLDENGKERGSVEFSEWLSKKSGYHKRLVFVVGGPYGLSDKLKEQYKEHISLSKMTFSHEMVRVIFFEQLYRAFTIIHGRQYHH